ncbi:hypothetical protein AUJ62_02660 [Candidatus Pacearchaeota archaeon CG1_02_32_21]|nr:MAG: hypothetical protein AUJ62_02660 [Candidatus Pacearchaeota archaeon CG1_02_32_21]
MTRAIIFDLDNTLIDFVETKNLVIQESVKAMIDAGLKANYESLLKEFSSYYWKHGIEEQKIFQKFLKQKYGKIDYKILAHAILAYRKTKNGLLSPYPGAKNMLIALKEKGLKLAILSDAPRLEAYLRLCSVGFDDFFDVILTKDDTKSIKPHAKGFLLAAKKLGVNPKDCVMVGDRPEKDIIGAKNLGMKTIFAKYGNVNAKSNEADATANDVSDIAKIVTKGDF